MALVWRMPGGARRRKLAAPCEHERGGMESMGSVGALVIGAPRGAPRGMLYRQGMAGMGAGAGATARALFDRVTGGAVGSVEGKLAQVSTALKISTAAAVISALASLYSLRRK